MLQSRNKEQVTLRKSFSNNQDKQSIPHLISLQQDSYDKFLQLNVKPEERKNIGIQSVFNSFFPVSDSAGKVTVEFISYNLKQPRFESSECLSAGKTFSSALSANLRLVLWHQEDGSDIKEIKSIKEQEVYFCEIPLMTESGSFIFNGAERVIVSQMRRAPGVFFDSENAKVSGTKSYTAKIIPHIGSWLDFEFDGKDILHFRIDKKRKIPATTLLRAIGLTSENIITNFYGSHNAFITKNGWAINFDQSLFNSKKIPYDLISPDTGEIAVKEGTKINRKLIEKLTADKFESYKLTDEALLGFVYAQDLVESETGELLLEAGSIVTAESLEILQKLNFKNVKIINPSKSDIGPYIYNTLIVDKI